MKVSAYSPYNDIVVNKVILIRNQDNPDYSYFVYTYRESSAHIGMYSVIQPDIVQSVP